MIRTTQNCEIFDNKLFAMLTILDIITGTILKEVSVSETVKQY